MERKKETALAIAVLIVILLPVVWAATIATTNFVFNVPTSRAHTLTYGGSCTTSAFFFNEADANFDPDTDGNAARVKPSPSRATPTDVDANQDYNFSGATSPQDKNVIYRGSATRKPPLDNNTISVQPNTSGYGFVATNDAGIITVNTSTIGEVPSFRFNFTSNYPASHVQDLNFVFVGSSQKAIDLTPCSASWDLNVYFWNYVSGAYQQINGTSGNGAALGDDGQNVHASASQNPWSTPVSSFIGSDRNIVVMVQGMIHDSSGQACGIADYAHMVITYFSPRPDFCQSSTLAPMTITNTGNVDINLDGNFTAAFLTTDINLQLKVWQGTGSGCGTDGNGLGGWQNPCGVTTMRPEVRWEFNDDSNQFKIVDSSGNGHHGTRVGTGGYTNTCYDGNCLYKMDLDDINIENNITFLDENFTIATWYYFTTDPSTNNIVSTENGGGGNKVYLELDSSSYAINCFAGSAGPATSTYDGGSLSDMWHQIVCTRKTDGNVVLYLDGAWFADAIQTTGDLDLVGGGNSYLQLAKNATDGTSLLDRTEIYTKAMNASQVLELYNSGWATPADWNTAAPTSTMCRQYDKTNASTGARLITRLAVGDTNQLCFSGDFNAWVSPGDHNKTFQTGSQFS